jgi:hypothetical protein
MADCLAAKVVCTRGHDHGCPGCQDPNADATYNYELPCGFNAQTLPDHWGRREAMLLILWLRPDM